MGLTIKIILQEIILTLYQVMSFSFLFVIRKLLKQYLSIVSLNSVSKRKWEGKKIH